MKRAPRREHFFSKNYPMRTIRNSEYFFPNDSVTTFDNITKDWSAYVMEIGVAYKENTDRVTSIMKEVWKDLLQNLKIGKSILDPIEIMGVDTFEELEVVIKTRIKAIPIEQWAVGREYRRRLKQTFGRNTLKFASLIAHST